MNLIRTSFKFSKKEGKILLFLAIIGIIMGYLFYKNIDSSLLKQDLINIKEILSNSPINFLPQHFMTLSILIFSSFLIFGIILFPIYFIWEFACISYAVFIFQSLFGLPGILFGFIYQIMIKLFYLIFLYFIFKNVFMLIVNKLFSKNTNHAQSKKQYQTILFSILAVFVYDILLYFLGNHLLLKFCFILD